MTNFTDFKSLVIESRSVINEETVKEDLLRAEQVIAQSIKNEPFLEEWKYTKSVNTKGAGDEFIKVFNKHFKDKTQLNVFLCETNNYKTETYYILFSFRKML